MMRYLLFISSSVLFCSFSTSEPSWVSSQDCVSSAVPKFYSELYDASIDVTGHHISGLLLFKTMPDSSQRAVFTNETGITYFDFEWDKKGNFKTYRVIRKLKKKIVLNTLQKDFELIVVPASIRDNLKQGENDPSEYFATRKKEVLRFKMDSQCQSLVLVEVMGKKSKLVDCGFFPEGKNIPDSVSITHHNFNMKIVLKRIVR